MNLNLFDKLKSLKQLFQREMKSSRESAKARKKLQQNFLKDSDPENEKKNFDEIMSRKNQSMLDSQGVNNFSGSAYNGPGNVDHEKIHSNRAQRNF